MFCLLSRLENPRKGTPRESYLGTKLPHVFQFFSRSFKFVLSIVNDKTMKKTSAKETCYSVRFSL